MNRTTKLILAFAFTLLVVIVGVKIGARPAAKRKESLPPRQVSVPPKR